MVRKLSLMLVLALGSVPIVAHSLGLGDVIPNSSLNQKVDAEIKLTSVAKGEIDDIRVKLADDAAFKRSGVDRLFMLTKLRFKPELKADGTAIIRITSSDPIREPFLNFLVEVNWPKGRLVREYTVLLDPPVTLERKPAPVQAPAVTAPAPAPQMAPRQVVEPTQKNLVQSVHPAYSGTLDEVKVQKNSSLWVIARKHKHPEVDQHRMMMAIYYANPKAFIKNNINRLKAGAILRIPNREDVLELEKREAQQEYQQHVQAWHADAEIARPDPGPAPEVTSDYVAGIMQEQQKAAEDEQKPAEETPVESDSKPAEEPAMEADGELKIATARPEGEGEAGPSEDSEADQTISRLKQELMIYEEEAERARGEGEELSSRVDDLEGQLEDIERLLELKSEQLSNMQAALARSQEEQNFLEKSNKRLESDLARTKEEMAEVEAKSSSMEEEAKPEPMAEDEKSEPVAEETQPEPVVEEEKSETVAEESEPEPVVEEEKSETMAEESEPEAIVEEESETVAEQTEPESAVKELDSESAQPAPAVTSPATEPSILDEIKNNPTLLGVVVGVVVILLGLVWILLSRKRANDTDFQESILLNTMEDEPEMLEEPTDIPSHHTEETSFLSDFSPSDIDALQDETGEVDPLSEADVYIAYGRYQQAEELIRQAIDKEPERAILKYKLFEILYAVKNADGFIALAEESANTPVETSDKESWEKVLSMGKKLSPEHSMFASASEIDTDDELFNLDDDLLDEDLDENDFADLDATLAEADFDMEDGDEAEEGEENLLSEDDLLSLSNEMEDSSLTLDDTGVDLDSPVEALSDLELESDLNEESINSALEDLDAFDGSEEVVEAAEDAEDDLMLSLSDLEDESEKTVLSLSGVASQAAEDDLDDALADLDLEIGEATTSLQDELLANEMEETVIDFPEQEVEKLELPEDTEGLSLDDPLEKLDLPDDIDVADEMTADLSEEEDLQDEVKTKLDLARAYVEMGDKDGAMDILEEVMSEGDSSQKEEAQSIKDSLA